MEDTAPTPSSTTKEIISPIYYPGSFHEVLRAILKCLGLETQLQRNPSSCPKLEDDGSKLNHKQLDSPKETSDPPPGPPSTTGDDGGSGFQGISLSTPSRPGTGRGRGGQIN